MKTKRIKKTLFLDSVLVFGKHNGLTMRQVIDLDINYAEWYVDIYEKGVADEVMLAIYAIKPKEHFKYHRVV